MIYSSRLKTPRDPVTFCKRRRIGVEQKKKLLEQLKFKTAYNVQNELLNQIDNKDPLQLKEIPSTKALTEMKIRNCKIIEQPTFAVRRMMYDPQYSCVLKNISTDPLQIMYWAPLQVAWFNLYKKNEDVILILDATGGLVKRVDLQKELNVETRKAASVFFYTVVAKTKFASQKRMVRIVWR